jgi:hypothetical protein
MCGIPSRQFPFIPGVSSHFGNTGLKDLRSALFVLFIMLLLWGAVMTVISVFNA